ncbi:hypothetical protein EYF80_024486 [Liparis tanakae]|uniref:Uncharacterized protein n=1 Tax=Liparis tanakae TaxID=230148 RepID=A0A4Z2HID1_9TELE|nr:hypothetical protein EYF80_024486 [Liparis tanakae]
MLQPLDATLAAGNEPNSGLVASSMAGHASELISGQLASQNPSPSMVLGLRCITEDAQWAPAFVYILQSSHPVDPWPRLFGASVTHPSHSDGGVAEEALVAGDV